MPRGFRFRSIRELAFTHKLGERRWVRWNVTGISEMPVTLNPLTTVARPHSAGLCGADTSAL